MCEGVRENGTVIDANAPLWDGPHAAAQQARGQPRAWLEQRRIYGNPIEAKPLMDAFSTWLSLNGTGGLAAALSADAQR
jgi:mannitol 2-dehydrogenase